MQVLQGNSGQASGLFCSALLDVAGGLNRKADGGCNVCQRPVGRFQIRDFCLPGSIHMSESMVSHNKSQWQPIMIFHNHGRMDIGQRIRQEREALGMTRAELARLADIKYPTLAGIENGDQAGSTRLHAIAAALGVSISWLESGRGRKLPSIPASSESHSLRITADIIRDAQAALRSMARIGGHPPSWETDPENLALAINTVIEVGTADGGNVIDLMAKIADTMRKGAGNAADGGTNGRGDSTAVSSSGNGKPKA